MIVNILNCVYTGVGARGSSTCVKLTLLKKVLFGCCVERASMTVSPSYNQYSCVHIVWFFYNRLSAVFVSSPLPSCLIVFGSLHLRKRGQLSHTTSPEKRVPKNMHAKLYLQLMMQWTLRCPNTQRSDRRKDRLN